MSTVMEPELTPSWELCNCAIATQMVLMFNPLWAVGLGAWGSAASGGPEHRAGPA